MLITSIENYFCGVPAVVLAEEVFPTGLLSAAVPEDSPLVVETGALLL